MAQKEFVWLLCWLIFAIEWCKSGFSTMSRWYKFSRSILKNTNILQTIRYSEKCPVSFLWRLIFTIERHTCQYVTQWPWPKFSRSNFSNSYFDKYWLENINIAIAIRYEVRYLPSIGATANVVHRDLDLHFKVTNFELWTSRKQWELANNAPVWLS